MRCLTTALACVVAVSASAASAATLSPAPVAAIESETVEPATTPWRVTEQAHRDGVLGGLTENQAISCADHGCFNRTVMTVATGKEAADLTKLQSLLDTIGSYTLAGTPTAAIPDLAIDHLVRIARRSASAPAQVLHDDNAGNQVTAQLMSNADERDINIVDTVLRVAEPGRLSMDSDFMDLPHNDYGPLTTVLDPLSASVDDVVVTNKRIATVPSVADVTLITASAPPVLNVSSDPWEVPVSGDLSEAATLEDAFASFAHRVGYRFVSDGPAFDTRVIPALMSPVPESLKTLHAGNMRDAMVRLAGPGLTVVVDHASRAVSVDFCPGYNNMLKMAKHLAEGVQHESL